MVKGLHETLVIMCAGEEGAVGHERQQAAVSLDAGMAKNDR